MTEVCFEFVIKSQSVQLGIRSSMEVSISSRFLSPVIDADDSIDSSTLTPWLAANKAGKYGHGETLASEADSMAASRRPWRWL